MASIVMMSKFKIANSKYTDSRASKASYSHYVDYMDREDAKQALDVERDSTRSEYNTMNWGYSTLEYLGDADKTNNTFTKDSYALNAVQVNQMKKDFDLAQQGESPLWQTVFSFDNEFLVKEGYLSRDGKLNDVPLKDATRKAMDIFIKDMNFNDTVSWVGAVHYNTDNIHIHVALVEQETSRDVFTSGKYKGERIAKPSRSVLRKMKSTFANQLVDRTHELTRASEIARLKIREPFKRLSVKRRLDTKREIKQLLKLLPEDRRKWKYNMNALKEVRPIIDGIVEKILDKKFSKELEELKRLYKDETMFREELYGKSKHTNYYENQMQTFKAALGNALLYKLKQEYPKHPKDNVRKQGREINSSYMVPSRFLEEVKYHLRATRQDYLNRQKHRELEYESGLDR